MEQPQSLLVFVSIGTYVLRGRGSGGLALFFRYLDFLLRGGSRRGSHGWFKLWKNLPGDGGEVERDVLGARVARLKGWFAAFLGICGAVVRTRLAG
jgi:hypothetical protein